MALARLTSARWVLCAADGSELPAGNGGWPYLALTFADGRVAWVPVEQKPLFYGYDAAMLGLGFERDTRWTMPGEPFPGVVFHGATDDPQIVRLVRDFWRVAMNGPVDPHTVDIDAEPQSQ